MTSPIKGSVADYCYFQRFIVDKRTNANAGFDAAEAIKERERASFYPHGRLGRDARVDPEEELVSHVAIRAAVRAATVVLARFGC